MPRRGGVTEYPVLPLDIYDYGKPSRSRLANSNRHGNGVNMY